MSELPAASGPNRASSLQVAEVSRKRHHAGCSDVRGGRGPLPTAWPILHLAVTDFELVRELPTGRAEVLDYRQRRCRRQASTLKIIRHRLCGTHQDPRSECPQVFLGNAMKLPRRRVLNLRTRSGHSHGHFCHTACTEQPRRLVSDGENRQDRCSVPTRRPHRHIGPTIGGGDWPSTRPNDGCR